MILASLCALTALTPKLLMAHYMPWYEANSESRAYGWHWTMNHFSVPDGQLASHYRPDIGPYDSRDPKVVEYQLLTMKMAGIDGVLIDWYGIDKVNDYPMIQEASQLVFEETKKLGMKFGVVYEDQTLPQLILHKATTAETAVETGHRTMVWVAKNWMTSPHYVRILDKPLMMVFGPQYYKPEDWSAIFKGIDVSFFNLHFRKGMATGGFDWPVPEGGLAGARVQHEQFLERSKDWPVYIAGAYPRFNDIYRDAGVGGAHDQVSDQDGKTYVDTLTEAMKGPSPIVQLITWNDWGEGTQLEPSKEFGYRDLIVTQRLKKQLWNNSFPRTPDDLKLPARLFALRTKGLPDSQLDPIRELISAGKTGQATRLIRNLEVKTAK